MAPPQGKKSGSWAQTGYYWSMGFVLPAGALAGYLVGWVLDRWLNTQPALAVVMTVLGVVGGFIELFRIMERAQRREQGNDQR